MRRTGLHWVALKIWVAFPLLLAVAAAGAESGTSDPPLDPIVSQVVEMLKAGVSDNLIVQWLEATGRRPTDVGSRGLIALTEAGASVQLTNTLLELVGERREGEPAIDRGLAQEPRSVEGADSPAPTAEPQVQAGGGVEATIRVSAKRVWVEEDEPDSPRDERWTAYVYLDGDFVAWVRPDRKGEPVEAQRVIQPGHHEIRLVLQRYEESRKGWSYESLAVPTLVAFETSHGDPIAIEIEMKRIWGLWRDRKEGGPLSYVIRQGSQVLAENDGVGGNPERWQPICEDVEANFPATENTPRAFRSSMERCVRWDTLWSDVAPSTSRADILNRLAEHDFEPPIQ